MALFNRKVSKDSTPPPPPVTYTPPAEENTIAVEEVPELDFLKEPAPAPEVPELDFLKAPAAAPETPVSTTSSSAAFETSADNGGAVPGLAVQNQYKRLVLETEMPPVITVCRYGTNYVATDHVRNLQAVESTEYEALESLLKQFKH